MTGASRQVLVRFRSGEPPSENPLTDARPIPLLEILARMSFRQATLRVSSREKPIDGAREKGTDRSRPAAGKPVPG